MKKFIFSLLITAFVFNSSFARNGSEKHRSFIPEKTFIQKKTFLQDDSGVKCFNENSKILNTGIGAGSGYYGLYKGTGYSYRSSPAFSITYEQALPKKLGPGYLGIGAYLGYQSASSRYNNVYYGGTYYYYEHKWRSFLVAARAAYHLDFLNSERAEVYAGVIAGLRIQTYTYNSNNPDPYYKNYYKLNEGRVFPAFSLFAGARWYFVQNVGLFAEVGYGISYGTIGFSFKL